MSEKEIFAFSSDWLQNDVCPVVAVAAAAVFFLLPHGTERKNRIEWNCFLWLCSTRRPIFTLHQFNAKCLPYDICFCLLCFDFEPSWQNTARKKRKEQKYIESHCESRHRCYHHLWLSAVCVHPLAKFGGVFYLLRRHTITSVVASCAFFCCIVTFSFPDIPHENAYQHRPTM